MCFKMYASGYKNKAVIMFKDKNQPLVMIRTGFILMKTKVSIVPMAIFTSTNEKIKKCVTEK